MHTIVRKQKIFFLILNKFKCECRIRWLLLGASEANATPIDNDHMHKKIGDGKEKINTKGVKCMAIQIKLVHKLNMYMNPFQCIYFVQCATCCKS